MFLSMTGYGSKTVVLSVSKEEKISFSVEIKSINSRFFENTCKLPSFLNSLELDIINILKQKLIRGRVYLTLRTVDGEDVLIKINPSFNIIEEYLNAALVVKDKFKISGELSISDILKFPNVFSSERGDVSSKSKQEILKIISEVADQVVKSRAIEGKVLQRDLEKRFDICGKAMSKVKVLFKKLMEKQKKLIQDALAKKEKGEDIESLKLDDLYSTLNKIDIHEEVTRFNSHLEGIKKVIRDKNIEKGKRIDFIMQELVRESNTILAKCSSYEISSIAVDIKVELEKAREQAQNVV